WPSGSRALLPRTEASKPPRVSISSAIPPEPGRSTPSTNRPAASSSREARSCFSATSATDTTLRATCSSLPGCQWLVASSRGPRSGTCKLGTRRFEEETAWLERYHQVWDSRFDELDKVVEELKRK